MLLEALGLGPSFPTPLSLSTLTASPAHTVAPREGVFLTSLTWKLNPVLSVLWDNVTQSRSTRGWYLADSDLTVSPPLTPPLLNGGLSLIPAASPVTVTFALSMSSTFSSTLLTQRIPIAQLLANIVGLSGILAFFGHFFGAFESWTPKKRKKTGGRNPLTLAESSNVLREMPPPTAEPKRKANERSFLGMLKRKGPATSHPSVEPPAAEFTTTLNPLH